MDDRNVTAAARHFNAEEAAAESACAAAATAHGITADQAEQCDDGDQGCPACPWRKDASGVDTSAECLEVKGNPRDGHYCDECGSGPCTRAVPGAPASTDPSAFQRRVLDTLTAGQHNSMSLTELAVRLKSNRLAVHSAVRSLESNGWAVSFRSERSQWAVLLVAPSHAWRDRIAASGLAVPRADESKGDEQ